MSPFKLRYGSRRLLARILARIELHHVEQWELSEVEMLWKRRRRGSQLAVSLGNLYLRMQRADVEILTNQKWLCWELALWNAMNENASGDVSEAGLCSSRPSIRSNGLMAARAPGKPLRAILQDHTRPFSSQLQCVEWVLQALEDMHARIADWGGGRVQPISHGDATAENVIVDVPNRRACWIDFDTRHRANLPAIERHADDLRALIFSTALHLTQAQYPRLNAQLRASYKHRQVIAHFQRRLISDWRRPNAFQLAQAPLSFTAARALSRVLTAD